MLTFEEFAGHDGAKLSKFYQGIRFYSERGGLEWTAKDIDSSNHSFSSWTDSGYDRGNGEFWIRDNVAAGPNVAERARIDFLNGPASFVELNYSSENSLVIRAYNAEGELVDRALGRRNRRFADGNENGPGLLRLEAPQGEEIAYLTFRGSGGYWVLDQLASDADITVVPLPAALGLGLIGLAGIAITRRRSSSRIA